MKYFRIFSVCLLCVEFTMVPHRAAGREQPAPNAQQFEGKVMAGEGGRLKPRQATLEAGKKVYRLVLDEKGRSLTKVMHGQRAGIWGIASEKDGVSWLKVLDYTDERMTAGHELWRHMRCSACVVTPALLNSTEPRNLQGAVPVHGRYWGNKERITAWTHDSEYLWLASDSSVYQVDFNTKKLLKTYGRVDGLPDQPVYALTSDGKSLWIVCKGSVVSLGIESGKISRPDWLACDYGQVAAGPEDVWVMTTAGTFRFQPGQDPATAPSIEPGPPLPMAKQIAASVAKGIWVSHWQRRTAHFIAQAVVAGGKVLVSSYGDIYEYDGVAWNQIATAAWALQTGAGRVWFLDSKGLNEYVPETGKRVTHELPSDFHGQYTRLALSKHHAWVAIQPSRHADAGIREKGGLCRYDMKSREWQSWADINGHSAGRVVCMTLSGESPWAVTATGASKTRGADPGMSHVKHTSFTTTGFHLHTLKDEEWDSLKLDITSLDSRLVCGQDGCSAEDEIFPRQIMDVSAGTRSIFGVVRLLPGKYFGGYWPSISRLADRTATDAPWKASFHHRPAELGLQGNLPQVLNISYGMIHRESKSGNSQALEAVGHDNVLALFQNSDTHWAVTEGCAAWYDDVAGQWTKAVETHYRYYWRATAALQEGGVLYVGSDRGTLCRLDLATGQFKTELALVDREIIRIDRNADGHVVVLSRPAEIGMLPVGLKDRMPTVPWVAAEFDGEKWSEISLTEGRLPVASTPFEFRQMESRIKRDKSSGNFLVDTRSGKPRIYLKNVFYPLALCTANDGETIWVSTYTGLVRAALHSPSAKKE